MTSCRTSKLRETPQGGPGPEPSHRHHGVSTPVDRHQSSPFVVRPSATADSCRSTTSRLPDTTRRGRRAGRRSVMPTRGKGGSLGGVRRLRPRARHDAGCAAVAMDRPSRLRGDDRNRSTPGRGAHRKDSWCQLKVWAADPWMRRRRFTCAELVHSSESEPGTSGACNRRQDDSCARWRDHESPRPPSGEC